MNLEIISNETSNEKALASIEDLINQPLVLHCEHQVRCSELVIREVMTQTGIELQIVCPKCGN